MDSIPSTFISNAASETLPSSATDQTSNRGLNNHSITKRLQNELFHLMTNPTPGISAFPESDSNLIRWSGTIEGPKDTPYEGLNYKILLEFPLDYPYHPPIIEFKTPMWHPNVNSNGQICLDILKEKWSPAFNIQTILISLQSLLGEPNNQSPLNSKAAILWDHNMAEFKKIVLDQYEKAQKSINSY